MRVNIRMLQKAMDGLPMPTNVHDTRQLIIPNFINHFGPIFHQDFEPVRTEVICEVTLVAGYHNIRGEEYLQWELEI